MNGGVFSGFYACLMMVMSSTMTRHIRLWLASIYYEGKKNSTSSIRSSDDLLLSCLRVYLNSALTDEHAHTDDLNHIDDDKSHSDLGEKWVQLIFIYLSQSIQSNYNKIKITQKTKQMREKKSPKEFRNYFLLYFKVLVDFESPIHTQTSNFKNEKRPKCSACRKKNTHTHWPAVAFVFENCVAIKTIPNNLIRVRTCLNFKNFALTPTLTAVNIAALKQKVKQIFAWFMYDILHTFSVVVFFFPQLVTFHALINKFVICFERRPPFYRCFVWHCLPDHQVEANYF